MACTIVSKKQSFIDDLIWVLTTVLLSSFLLFDTNKWISYILLAISIVIFLLSAWKNKGIIHLAFDRYHMQVFLFAMFCACSALWAHSSSGDALTKGITVVEILICMSMLYTYYQTQPDVHGLIMSIKWAGFITTIYTFVFYGWSAIVSTVAQSERLTNAFANINSVAMFSALGLIVVCYQWLYEGFSLNFIFGVPSVIIVAASGSRKAFVLAFVGVLLVFIMRYSSRNIFKNILKYFIIIVGALFIFKLISELSIFSGVMERMDGLFALITGKGTIDSSSSKRDLYMKIAFGQILENPILGIGMDNARYVIGAKTGITTYSHNNFAELICDGGVVGFCIYYSMYFYCLKNFIKYRNVGGSLTKVCLVLAIAMLLMDWGMVSYYSKSQYFYLMLFYLQVKNIRREIATDQSKTQECHGTLM